MHRYVRGAGKTLSTAVDLPRLAIVRGTEVSFSERKAYSSEVEGIHM